MRNMQTIFKPNGKKGQQVAFLTASPVNSDPVSDHCFAVELYATQDVYIEIDGTVEITGSTTGAVTSGLSHFIPASTLTKISVESGPISIQGATADGTLYINELTA